MRTVVDASFAVHVQTHPNGATLARRLAELASEGVAAPVIFWFEIASVLRKMRLRQDLTSPQVEAVLASLRRLDIVIETPPSAGVLLAASEAHQLTIYDAAYLELALRTGARLATRDQGLVSAAARAGVPVIGPSPR